MADSNRIDVRDDRGDPASAPVAAAAVSLAAGRFDRIAAPSGLLSDDAFVELVAVAEHHRILGALVEAVEADHVVLTDDQRQHLSSRERTWLVNALRLERLLGELSDAYAEAGVDFRVLKGVALGRLAYGDPSWRVFADLDLLVPSQHIDRAAEVACADLGAERPTAELRPGFDEEFGKDITLRVGRLEVDIHRTLVSGPFGLMIEPEALFADSTTIHVGGRRLAALGPIAQYVHACYNLAVGDFPPRLGAVRDLLVIDQAGAASPDEVEAIARRWRGTALVRRAATIMSDVLGDDTSSALDRLARLDVPRRERLLLRSQTTTARSYRQQLAGLFVIKGIRPKLRYARALVSPSPEYLASRGWSETGHLRRAMRRLGGGQG